MYVYFIHNPLTDNYKVGKTKSLEGRIKQLQTGNETRLEIRRSINDVNPEIEKYIHEYFKDKKILNEWFDITLNDIEYVIKLVEYANFIKLNKKTNINYPDPKDAKLISRIVKWNNTEDINFVNKVNKINKINKVNKKPEGLISLKTFIISMFILWLTLLLISNR